MSYTPSASTSTNITAATKTAIVAQNTVVTTVASGTSVQLTSPTLNLEYKIVNRGANALLVYPPSGAQFEANGTNSAVQIASGGLATFLMTTLTQGYVY